MPRPRNADRPREKAVSLPGSLLDRADAVLTDPHEGKVPHGRYAKLFTLLLANWLVTIGEMTPLEAQEYLDQTQPKVPQS